METAEKLLIEKLVYGGDGLGYQNGKAVFIPFSAPGDSILWRITENKRRFQRGVIHKILTESPQRIAPECPLFGKCGGCQWQHLSYSAQIQWKESIFRSMLTRQCGVHESFPHSIIPSPSIWNYRSRARLRVKWENNHGEAGFLKWKSHTPVPLHVCFLLEQKLNIIIQKISRHLLNSGAAAALGIRGFILETGDTGGSRIILEYADRQAGPKSKRSRKQFIQDASETAAACPFPVSVWMRKQGGSIIPLFSDGTVDPEDRFPVVLPLASGAVHLRLPPGGFSQINLEQNRRLVLKVCQAVNETLPGTILDLYCGMGNFTIPLAGLCRAIHGVDAAPASIDAARNNAVFNGADNASFTCMPMEKFAGRLENLGDYSLVLLDPPRIGAREVMSAITAVMPETVIYVSCDPMTLCRDLKVLLDAGYRVRWSVPVDLFPHTYHIESITVLDDCSS